MVYHAHERTSSYSVDSFSSFSPMNCADRAISRNSLLLGIMVAWLLQARWMPADDRD